MPKKQPSKFKQKTNLKIFTIKLALALRKASQTELDQVAIVVQTEYNRRAKKGQYKWVY